MFGISQKLISRLNRSKTPLIISRLLNQSIGFANNIY